MDWAERAARLRLARSPNVGPVTFRQLLEVYGTAPRALAAIPTLARRGGRRIEPAPLGAAEAEIERGAALGAQLIAFGDEAYPRMLSAIHDPPPVLWVRGDPAILARRSVAIVGARNASALGMRFAQMLARDLGAAGVAVVSGMARGIDAAAHIGALDSGTAAVLAGGVDSIYPPENAGLYAQLCARAAVVAESPPGAEPRARDFPRRNRIVSGLSLAVVVAEGAERSGSLITARMALDQGREAMAVPGSPLDPRAGGCNLLIREGAALIRSAADVLEALPAAARVMSEPPQPFEKPDPSEPADDLRRDILRLLGPSPVEIDLLLRETGAPPAQAALVLLELELAGRLSREPGGRVALTPL